VTRIAVSGGRQPYRIQFFDLLEFVTFRTQSIGSGRQGEIASLLWPNVEIVIVVFEVLDAAEYAVSPVPTCAQLVTHLAVVGEGKSFRGNAPRLGRRSSVTHKTRAMALLGFEFLCAGRRPLYLLMTVGAARTRAGHEL